MMQVRAAAFAWAICISLHELELQHMPSSGPSYSHSVQLSREKILQQISYQKIQISLYIFFLRVCWTSCWRFECKVCKNSSIQETPYFGCRSGLAKYLRLDIRQKSESTQRPLTRSTARAHTYENSMPQQTRVPTWQAKAFFLDHGKQAALMLINPMRLLGNFLLFNQVSFTSSLAELLKIESWGWTSNSIADKALKNLCALALSDPV